MNLSVKPLHRSEQTSSGSQKQSSGFLRPLIAGTLVACCSVFVTLLVVEAIIRLFFSPAAVASWSDRPQHYYKPFHSKTFQDLPYPEVKAEGHFRIAVLGDSFSFATQMQITDAFPKQLERILKMGEQGESIEVINYGVPGYSTSNEAVMMKQAIKEGADLIVLQITLNDPQLKPYAPKGITGKNEFGSYRPEGWAHSVSSFWKTPSFVLQRLHNTQTHQSYVNYYFDLFRGQKTRSSFEQSVKLIGRRGRRNKVPVVAVVFPLFGLPVNDSYPFLELHEQIHGVLDTEEIPYLDLFEEYKGIPLSRIQLIPGQDFHPNEIGHRIAAEAIYEWLEKSELLPSHYVLKDKYQNRLDIRPDKNQPSMNKETN